MTFEEKADNQMEMAMEFAGICEECEHDPYTILDDLACAGLKLERLEREDFDNKGVSVVSYAFKVL